MKIYGIDCPFAQSRTFIESIDWPDTRAGNVDHAAGLGRDRFRDALGRYRAARAPGDKELRRATDRATGAISRSLEAIRASTPGPDARI